jgi:hypothetical protein
MLDMGSRGNFAGEKEVGAKNELSMFATTGRLPAAGIGVLHVDACRVQQAQMADISIQH